MNKTISLLTGAVMVLSGLVTAIIFDMPPYISSSITFLGLGVIFATLSRDFPDKNTEND